MYGPYGILDTLYSALGSSGMFIGQTYHKAIGARVGQDFILQWDGTNKARVEEEKEQVLILDTERNESIEVVTTTERYTRVRCLGMMNSGAVVRWSKYPIITGQVVACSLSFFGLISDVALCRTE